VYIIETEVASWCDVKYTVPRSLDKDKKKEKSNTNITQNRVLAHFKMTRIP
jgi:hypothetical protein